MAAFAAACVLTAAPLISAAADDLPWLRNSGSRYDRQYEPPATGSRDYDDRDTAPPPRYEERYRGSSRGDEDYPPPRAYDEPRSQRYAERATYETPADIRSGTCDRTRLPYNISKQTAGGAVGGIVGGLLGSQVGKGGGRTAATVVGALLGLAAGSYLGRNMDAADQYCARQALEYAPTNRSVRWQNPDTDSSYVMIPGRTYESDEGRYCREYTTKATVGGETKRIHGIACRRPDGTWEMISQQ